MMNKANLASLSEPCLSRERLAYEEAQHLTELEIKKLLKTAPPVLRRPTSHLARAMGKGLRAQALLACAMGEDGLVSSGAVKAAAAIELLHLATLIHDDIIDEAALRRGIDTLHVKFGQKIAVLCGDYLFCLAFDLAASIRPEEVQQDRIHVVLPSYFTQICLGEIREFSNTGNLDLTECEYFRIISGKTAALFQASFHVGFLLSDQPPEMEELYLQVGQELGIIFQLADDCLDFISSVKKAKKPVLMDGHRGVVTLPLIYALRVDKTLRGRLKKGLSAQELKAAVLAAGGIEYTQSKMKERQLKAKKLLAVLGPENKKILLEQLLDRVAAL
ncbi:MAG: polyprenyl synthetase family protein [Firmicutes bacterium]|nr:polyprenyl synthetase family protein [Bacillota bacterium]